MRRAGAFLAFLLASPIAAQEPYTIGPGDILRIVVVGQPDLTRDFPVDLEGNLTLPIVGKVKAAERSPLELERQLTAVLADGYLKRPQVSVTVYEYRSQRVSVTGEVQRPGPYALKADRSLLALIGDVGSLTANAGHEVVVIRPPKAHAVSPTPDPPVTNESPSLPPQVPGTEVFRVSLQDLLAGKPERNLILQAGDTVYVPRAAQIYVTGSVARPGPYRFQEGTTVLQALTLAGGITERGSLKRTKIVRVVDGKKKDVSAKTTDLVQPEDTIVVRERLF